MPSKDWSKKKHFHGNWTQKCTEIGRTGVYLSSTGCVHRQCSLLVFGREYMIVKYTHLNPLFVQLISTSLSNPMSYSAPLDESDSFTGSLHLGQNWWHQGARLQPAARIRQSMSEKKSLGKAWWNLVNVSWKVMFRWCLENSQHHVFVLRWFLNHCDIDLPELRQSMIWTTYLISIEGCFSPQTSIESMWDFPHCHVWLQEGINLSLWYQWYPYLWKMYLYIYANIYPQETVHRLDVGKYTIEHMRYVTHVGPESPATWNWSQRNQQEHCSIVSAQPIYEKTCLSLHSC